MAALAGQAGILTACAAAACLLALAFIALPELKRLLGALRKGSDSFAGLTATRRGIVGLPHAKEERTAAATEEASAGNVVASAPAHAPLSRGDGETGVSSDDTGRLLAIAALCSRVDLDVQKILAQLAELLPAAFPPPGPWSCRIELVDSVNWSPGYVNPTVEFEAPLRIGGNQVGTIRLGATGDSPPTELDLMGRALLDATAGLASQMLDNRADRFQLQKLRGELEQRDITIKQTARLVKIGAWEYDARSGLFKWSDEIRRITMIDESRAGRERERAVAKELLAAAEQSLATRKTLNHEFTCRQANGDVRSLHAIGDVQTVGGEPALIFGIIRDVTDEKEVVSRLTRIANHDALTELPNRRYFQETIESRLRERGAKGALLVIDIDRFKDLNDSGGHDIGDMLLRDFGRRLQEAACSAFAARLGGDEFAVLLPVPERMEAEHVARTLIAELSGPLVMFGRSTTVQVSAGLAMYPTDGRIATDLLKNADLALYEAKKRGRNMLVAYAADIRQASDERARICADVRAALPEKQFVPYYQPKIHLGTGEIAGFEALIRWHHPSGVRSPGQFAAALEDPELSRALCSEMLDRIIADMARWQAKELPFGRIAFNASSSEFSDFDLAGHLTWRLKSIGLAPSRISVEVTEAVFLDGDSEAIIATLTKLRKTGIEIALDDFGTGFASLTHLQDFPVDVIKIDQSFIRRLTTDAGSLAITSAVLQLGRSLGKTVVAEGVETAEQATLLRAAGCHQVQGYYFGRPMPGENVPKFVANWHGAEQISALERTAA